MIWKRASLVFAAFLVVVLSGAAAGAKCIDARNVDPAEFVLGIDNPYWPLMPGTTFVYAAATEDESIRNEVSVTYDTVDILGVACTVVYDVEWVCEEEGGPWVLSEETFDWYAQDTQGNIWYFGEATQEYLYDDDGNFLGISTEGSWKAGVDGALPGIIMLADPSSGVCYQQEYYEGEAEDYGRVLRLESDVSLEELGDFAGCLKTKEWTPLEPGSVEHKYYAPGVGLVLVEELKEKTVRVELVDIVTW